MPAIEPGFAWGLCARLLALVLAVAFTSLAIEILPLCGSRGITPARQKLRRMREDLGLWRVLLRHPSVLWLSSSDTALRWLPRVGLVAALLAAAGIASGPMWAVCWVAYLSLDVVIGLTFPWESMLLEACFLAIFLPPLDPLPSLAMPAPPPVLAFAYHLLLFRVLFGFGKHKFSPDAKKDPNYLRGFLISQPIPSPLGWLAFRTPRAILVAAHALMFVVEIPLPFLVFFPGWPRLLAAAGFVGLMLGIQAMGNFGFFNVLVIVLSVSLLDSRSVLEQDWRALLDVDMLPLALVATWVVLAGLIHLPFSTWVARGWPEWPVWGAVKTAPMRALMAVIRGTMPFRTVHAYGVFPPRSTAPLKWIPVFEGTRDGVTWEPFRYKYMPVDEKSPPRFVAPHCPRLCHWALYEGFGFSSGNMLGTLFSMGNPHDISPVSGADRVMQRLLEGDGPVRELFRAPPFPDAPPTAMRMRLHMLWPTTPQERRATGNWWHVRVVDEHLSARGNAPELWQRWIPDAVQFHPDDRWARRRIARLRPLLSGAGTLEARVLSVLDDKARTLWPVFWNDVVPTARGLGANRWSTIQEDSDALRERHGPAGVEALDRIRGAVATTLLESIEPHVLQRREPFVIVRTYFHAFMLMQQQMLEGLPHCERVVADPTMAVGLASSLDNHQGLALLALVRPGIITFFARKTPLLGVVVPPGPPPPDITPGFQFLLPFLAEAWPQPGQRIPNVVQTPEGEWLLDGQDVRAGLPVKPTAQLPLNEEPARASLRAR
ncbi:MAG: lipase maturation factor family protein [Myxococcota bacterium]